MRSSQRLMFLAALLLLFAFTVFGQTAGTTSTLSGSATTDGKALPGVTVVISSPSLQGTRTAVTGEGGGYTFPALPPGTYTVKFTLEGMQPVTKVVTLTLATPGRADAEMKVGNVSESITVTANAPAVLETVQVGTNFSQAQIEKLPIARNIRQTVLLAPGVNPNGVNNQITISGAPTYENIFMVNGVVVNENLRGQPHNLFIEDAIQETTVMTAGISAEYGRFTGGVVSTLTKSGGNEFSGSVRDSLTNPKWTATPNFPNTTTPPDKTNQVFEGTLGGRIIRDRLWFFAAGRKAKTDVIRSTFATNLQVDNAFDEKRYEGKLTGQVTSKHNLVLSYLKVKNLEINNIFPDIYDLASVVPNRQLPNDLKTVNYNGIFTSNFLGEVAWSKKTFAFVNSGGRFLDRIKGTWIGDSVSGARMNAPVFCGVCGPEHRDSKSIGGKGTYYLSTRNFGNHSIVFGADKFSETRLSNNYQSGSNFTITARVARLKTDPTQVVPVFDNRTSITYRPILVLSPGTDLSSNAVFANDRWDYNTHLSFNVGARFDKNHAKDADGNLVSNDSNFSPRVGLLWDLRGDGHHRVSASAARYVAKITDGSNVTSTAQAGGNPASFTYAYGGPTVNSIDKDGFFSGTGAAVDPATALATLFTWFDSVGGINSTNYLSSSYPGFASRFPHPLKSPAVDELSVGYGVQINSNAFMRFDAVHRQWHNFYAADMSDPTRKITPPNKVVADLLFTVNDDKFTERRYNALEAQGNWSRGRLNIGGNYTWSKLRGNDVGEGGGTATIRNTPGQLFYPEYLSYAQRRPVGFLAQDRRHRARLWAGYDVRFPFGNLNLSAIESFDSGFAYSALGTIDATGRNANFTLLPDGSGYKNIPKNPGYLFSGTGTAHDYFFSGRGAFRSASRTATDVALNYSLPFYGRFQAFIRGDVLNVFNKQVIVDPSLINNDVNTSRTGGVPALNADGTVKKDANGNPIYNSGLLPFNPFTDTPVQCPQSSTPAQCFAMKANWQLGPKFGQANSADAFQSSDRSLGPRTYRLTFGVRF